MTKPIVYGPRYSVYTRAVLMALLEKRAAHELVHVDMDRREHQAPEHLARHPFGLLPAFRHGDFAIYETVPILGYIDEAFPGARLMPTDLRHRTRAAQIMSVFNSYAYRPVVWGVFVPDAFPESGKLRDEARVAAAVPKAEQGLAAIEALMVDPDPYLLGREISLADLLVEPAIHYLETAPEGKAMLPKFPKLAAWHAALQSRPSVKQTVPKVWSGEE